MLHELELDPRARRHDATTADSPALQYAQLDTRATPMGKLVVFCQAPKTCLAIGATTGGSWRATAFTS